MARKLTGIQIARRVSLGFFLVATTTLTVLHQTLAGIPSIDAFCPFGGIETAYKFVAGGELLKRIEPSNILLFSAITLIGILLARFFCGWICAFGALQGVFGWFGKKILKKRFVVPPKADRVLRLAKYGVLVLILAFTWRAGELVIRPYDPWAAYGHLSAGFAELFAEFGVGFAVLVASLILSMAVERAFCKYLCPLGAFNAILSRIPILRIRRDPSTCVSCSACDKACPMNCDVMKADRVDDPECIACGECVEVCPTRKGTLKAFLFGKPARIAAVATIGLGIYFAAIGTSMVSKQFRAVPLSLSEKAKEGALSIADIKGSSTWKDVAESFGVEIAALQKEAGLALGVVPPETKLKDTAKAAGLPSFEADLARQALARILGVEYAGENAAPAQSTPPPPAEASPVSAPAPSPKAPQVAAPLVVPPGFELEGTMTVSEVATAVGATEDAVLAKLGLPGSVPRDVPLRDLKDAYGFKMPELKERFK